MSCVGVMPCMGETPREKEREKEIKAEREGEVSDGRMKHALLSTCDHIYIYMLS